MDITDEVEKTIDALKKAGFNPFDAVFEGAIGVKDEDTLALVQKLSEKQMAQGVVRVVYSAGDENAVRYVEIPVGEQSEEAQEAEEKRK